MSLSGAALENAARTPDDKVSENTREHLLTCHFPPTHSASVTRISNAQPPGREGLYYNYCQSLHRPKFVCAKSTCRRMVKPFYDPERHEYGIDNYQGWEVRPLRERHAEYAATVRRARSLGSHCRVNTEKQKEIAALRRRWEAAKWSYLQSEGEKSEPLTQQEMHELKMWDPEVWWTRITEGTSIRRELGTEAASIRQDRKRCPSCSGEVIRVGSNFRVPKKSNNKAWCGIVEMIKSREDLEAKFSMCWTAEAHKKKAEQAINIREGKSN
jgi:hypothetical protein